jgi:hypothetical protein
VATDLSRENEKGRAAPRCEAQRVPSTLGDLFENPDKEDLSGVLAALDTVDRLLASLLAQVLVDPVKPADELQEELAPLYRRTCACLRPEPSKHPPDAPAPVSWAFSAATPRPERRDGTV